MSRKGENIYKRKDKRWEARYIKGYTTEGAVRYGYCYGRSYREAKEKVEEAKIATLTSKVLTNSNLKTHKVFSHYCDEWLKLNRSKVKESTYVKYISVVEKHIIPKLGGCNVQALSSVLIEQFEHELLKENFSPKTVRDILIILRSILKYTNKHFPGEMQTLEIAYPKDTKKEMRVLTKDEQTRFVAYLLSDMDECKFGVMLALLTGLRIGEICALRWNDVLLEEGIIRIAATMQRIKNLDPNEESKTKVVISTPKSDNSARLIPLTKYAEELCCSWQAGNPDAFVLTGNPERYIEPRTLQYRLEHYTKECDLEGVHFHVLRHTFATRCVEVGFEIKSLSEILGHSSPRITLERYVHSSLELKRDNMNKLAEIGY